MIAETLTLDQPTIDLLREQDALVQRSRALFALLDWSQLDQQQASRTARVPIRIPKVPISKPSYSRSSTT